MLQKIKLLYKYRVLLHTGGWPSFVQLANSNTDHLKVQEDKRHIWNMVTKSMFQNVLEQKALPFYLLKLNIINFLCKTGLWGHFKFRFKYFTLK
jgi:hypothetical protein